VALFHSKLLAAERNPEADFMVNAVARDVPGRKPAAVLELALRTTCEPALASSAEVHELTARSQQESA
jgi:hypothetical protein